MMYWITHCEGGPQRVNHAAASVGCKIYSFGGYNSNEDFELCSKIDIHAFDTNTLRWRPVHYKNATKAPKKCYGHAVVAHGSRVYLWGGRNNLNASNTLYCFDTETLLWSLIPAKGTLPKKVDGHSACLIAGYIYVFGGFEEETEMFTNSVYRLSLLSFEWEKLKIKGEAPASRDFHTASVIDDRMYIFGGRSAENEIMSGKEIYNNDIMYLDTHSMTWIKPLCMGNPPCGRRSHSAVVYNKEVYIIGGFDGKTRYHLNDIYKFNPETALWSQMYPNGDPPCPRRRHCTCVVGDQLFLFGGSSPVNKEEYAKQYVNDPEDVNDLSLTLYDHGDTYVLDFFPSLKRLSQLCIIEARLKLDCLPQILVNEIRMLSTDAKLISLITNHPRSDFLPFGFSA